MSGVVGCDAYLDGVVLHSSTWTKQLCEVFERLWAANIAKCKFGKATVGRIVGGVVRFVQEYAVPSNRLDFRRFLGSVGYYQSFCVNFSSGVALLTNLLSAKVHFQWTETCMKAFQNVKALLMSAPVLAAPDCEAIQSCY